MALTDAELDPVIDIIGNKLALSVNQAWAGHPGGLVRTLPDPAPPPPAPGGCFIDGAVTYAGGNIMPGPHHGVTADRRQACALLRAVPGTQQLLLLHLRPRRHGHQAHLLRCAGQLLLAEER